jgi:hypothetical protein
MEKLREPNRRQIAKALAIALILWATDLSSETKPNPADSDTVVVMSPKPGDEVPAPFGFGVKKKNPSAKKLLNIECGLRNADGSTIDYVPDWADIRDKEGDGLSSTLQGAMMYFCPKSDMGSFEVWGDFGRISIPIKFKKESKAKVYFGNSKLQESLNSVCTVSAFPVERPGLGKNPTPRAALLELLKGPTKQEAEQGYWSSIAGMRLVSFSVKNGIATVHLEADKSFMEHFGRAGFCQEIIEVSPMEATLKQFCYIKGVTILVNGVPMEPQP